MQDLETRILALASDGQTPPAREAARDIEAFLDALEEGSIRAATRVDGRWVVHPWVKSGILLAFRTGGLGRFEGGAFSFVDREILAPRQIRTEDRVRLVPGGSSVRRGAHLAPGVVCMPPSFVNIGAYVGDDTMIDSHVLVGSCAQIGARVHLSAAVQIGGVLEPPGALPVIVEDDAFIGGGCGIYEGCLVREGAVLAPGVILTRATPVFDLVNETVIRPEKEGGVIEIPTMAVVVPGARAAGSEFGREFGLSLYTPVIVKYRDAGTSSATALESTLRLHRPG